jgi:hypothetical protein
VTDATAFERLVVRLEQQGSRVTGSGDQRQAQCPAHDDHNPSLSVRGIEGRALVRCHQGCDTADILAALNLTWSDLFDEPHTAPRLPGRLRREHAYDNGASRLVGTSVRTDPKSFRPVTRDGTGWTLGSSAELAATPYRLPEVIAAVHSGQPICVVEGEHDADTLARLGLIATCNLGGAGKWTADHAYWLKGADVIVIHDIDANGAGERHARAVVDTLTGLAHSIRVLRPADGHKDITDHMTSGRGIANLVACPELEPATGADPAARGVLVRLSDVTPETVSWLWKGRLPCGKLVVLDGDPGLGKSTLSLTFAAHVSTGRAWPDGQLCPIGGVVIMSAEDGLADTMRPRLDAAEADTNRIHALTAIEYLTDDGDRRERPPTLADIDIVRAMVEQTGAKLLIVDVLMAYLPSKVDSHRDQDVRGVLHQLSTLAEDTGCTVLLLRHLNKTGAGSPIYRGGGSIGIIGAARAGFLVAPDPDDDDVRVLACVKSNLAATPPSLSYRLEEVPGGVTRVVWGEESQHAAAALLRRGNPEERTDRTECDEAAEWLLGYLKDQGGRASRKDVFETGGATGFTEATLKRAKDKAHVGHESGGFPRTTVWVHPLQSVITTVGSGSGEPTVDEPTEPTGGDQQKRVTSPVQSAQLALSHRVEPTEPAESNQPPKAVTQRDDDWACDMCPATPSRLDHHSGARLCRICGPHLFDPSDTPAVEQEPPPARACLQCGRETPHLAPATLLCANCEAAKRAAG